MSMPLSRLIVIQRNSQYFEAPLTEIKQLKTKTKYPIKTYTRYSQYFEAPLTKIKQLKNKNQISDQNIHSLLKRITNMIYSRPVVFLAQSDPSSTGFVDPRCHQTPHFHPTNAPIGWGYHNSKYSPFYFFQKLALTILSLFAFSMFVRLMWMVIAVALSPPVLFLSLLGLLFSRAGQGWDNRPFMNFPNYSSFFNTIQQQHQQQSNCFGRAPGSCPRRCNRNGTSAGNDSSHGDQEQKQKQQQQQKSESEVTRGDTKEDRGTSNNNICSTNLPTISRGNATRYHKVPVHREETDEKLTLSLDISCFTISDIQVTVENSKLVIMGARNNILGDTFVVEEVVTLDEERFLENSVSAQLLDDNGILSVTIQKKPTPKPRVISITTTK
jgi:HSP20 family molecular chaperone IbpA